MREDRKTLFICSDFPPMISGIAKSLYNFWSRLPRQRVLVLAPKLGGCFEFDRKQQFEIIRYKTALSCAFFFRLINCFLLLLNSLYIIYSRKIKKIHCGQPLSAGIIGALLKSRGISYCVYVYGGETAKYRKYIFILPILKLILKRAEKIIVNSDFTRKEFLAYGIEESKFIKVTPGVDVKTFRPDINVDDLKAKFSLGRRKMLLTAARLAERKGHDMLIHALPLILEKVPDLVYIIAGSGPEEKKLKQLVEKKKLASYVVFVGSVSEEDVPLYYAACDVFVMPNRETKGEETFEGFGTSFIEAGASAKPVIAGRSGGAVEAVLDGETGILVNPLSREEIAAAAIKLLRDEKYAHKLGQQGRSRAEREFSWQFLAKKIETLL